VATAESIEQLLSGPNDNNLDVIFYNASTQNYLALNEALPDRYDVPVIVTSTDVDNELHLAHQVFGVLIKPLREAEVAAMILVAKQRHQEFRQLLDETNSFRAALADRKVIEQAKGMLMKRSGLDEANAFRHLQQLARRHRKKLVDVSNSILIGAA